MSYSVLAYDDDGSLPTAHYIKNIEDGYTLVNTIFNLTNSKFMGKSVNYEIQFLFCSSELTNCERKKIMKRHRQNYCNDSNAPAVKQQKLEARQTVYEVMTPLLKQVYS